MWRRAYLLLVAVRLYFALSPSYLHPDENFQGPEIIANRVFNLPSSPSWEFTSAQPIRSAFPLWLIYGIPMYILRWLWQGFRRDEPPPWLIFYTLRGVMFILSFVLEDWAVHELVPIKRQRRLAIILIASSYVTWTWQTHTFSNSIDTLLVLWCLVLVERMIGESQASPQKRAGLAHPAILAFLLIFGIFNRITFPAFIFLPSLQLIPYFKQRPFSLLFMAVIGTLTTLSAIVVDTNFYQPMSFDLYTLIQKPTITPLNNLFYNTDKSNLAQHGLHPFYQHAIVNIPQLLGPMYLLLLISPRLGVRLYSALAGCSLLSLFPHQEARFLVPAVPLLLSSIRFPKSQTRTWIGTWIAFNISLGVLMGVYHQGGVVPAQLYIGMEQQKNHYFANVGTVVWWKTYPPPTWLMGSRGQRSEGIKIVDMMGAEKDAVAEVIAANSLCNYGGDSFGSQNSQTLVVAPRSAGVPTSFELTGSSAMLRPKVKTIEMREIWRYTRHLNLDDLNWAEDGLWGTLRRVVAKRGIQIYQASAICD